MDTVVLADRFRSGRDVRLAARRGEHRDFTSGLAPGFVQGNLAIMPTNFAADFERFCQRNPKACPLLAISEPGDPMLPRLGADIDVRTDLPRYRVWQNGELLREVHDVTSIWRDDLVTFVLGSSFSFEQALVEHGIRLKHVEMGMMPPAYRTNIATVPAGQFCGPLVVTMRPLRSADAIRAIQITTRYPSVHGAPIHIGDPDLIGIADLETPEWGHPPKMQPGELPVFWACGVTPQTAIEFAKPEFCITHAPACMLVTDLSNASLALF